MLTFRSKLPLSGKQMLYKNVAVVVVVVVVVVVDILRVLVYMIMSLL